MCPIVHPVALVNIFKIFFRGFPRIAEYNIRLNIILNSYWSQHLRGLEPKSGDFILFRNTEKLVKYNGKKDRDSMKKWLKEKSKVKHDEL